MKFSLAIAAIIATSQAAQIYTDSVVTQGVFGETTEEIKFDDFIHRIVNFPTTSYYY